MKELSQYKLAKLSGKDTLFVQQMKKLFFW